MLCGGFYKTVVLVCATFCVFYGLNCLCYVCFLLRVLLYIVCGVSIVCVYGIVCVDRVFYRVCILCLSTLSAVCWLVVCIQCVVCVVFLFFLLYL